MSAAGAIEVVQSLQAIPKIAEMTGLPSRRRVVYAKSTQRLMDRLSKDLRRNGDKFSFTCGNQSCSDKAIKLRDDAGAEGGMVLRCGCTDRVFSRHI